MIRKCCVSHTAYHIIDNRNWPTMPLLANELSRTCIQVVLEVVLSWRKSRERGQLYVEFDRCGGENLCEGSTVWRIILRFCSVVQSRTREVMASHDDYRAWYFVPAVDPRGKDRVREQKIYDDEFENGTNWSWCQCRVCICIGFLCFLWHIKTKKYHHTACSCFMSSITSWVGGHVHQQND